MSSRNPRCRIAGLVLYSALALLFSSRSFAQADATLRGRVSDPDGAVIPDVQVTLRNRSIGYERTTLTDREGVYQIAALAPGTYKIEVRAAGFRAQLIDDIEIDIGRTVVQDFQLEIGDFAQEVLVSEASPGVEPATASVGRVIDQSSVRDLPLNGRNFLELAQLEPAVKVQSGTNPGQTANNYARVTVAGSFFSQTRISIDGSTVNDRFVGGTTQNFSQESVQEFQISTFNFDLAAGTPGAGVVNIISRRGENIVHGSGLFYYRDHNLAAYPGLARDPPNASPFFARRQSGFSLSGPIKRDRLFWFGNYEHNNQDAVFTVNNNHPIFSKLDVIHPNPLTADLFNIRMDWKASERSQAFFRYSLDRNKTIAPAPTVGMPSTWQSLRNDALQVQVGLTSIASARVVKTFRASYSYLNGQLQPVSGNECPDPSACIGIGQPAILTFDAPQFRIGNAVNAPFPRWVRNYQFVDDLTWQNGSHLVRLGGEWEHVYWKALFAFNEPAQMTLWGPSNLETPALKPIFDALPTSLKDPNGPPPTLSDILQLPLRSFITGIGSPTLPVPYNFDKASRNDRVRFYLQDAWRVRPDLTLNAGLAYSYETRLFHSDLQRPAYLSALLGGNLRAPQPDKNSFDPSLSLAWSPDKNRNTTIRLGAGIFTDQIAFYWSARERAFIAPSGSGRVNVDGALTPYNFVSVPTGFRGADLLPLLPRIRANLAAKLGDGSDPSTSAIEVIKQGGDIAAPDSTMTYSIHFAGGVQRRFSNSLLLSADYVMRRYVKLGPLQDVFVLDANRFNRPLVTGVDAATGAVSFVRNPVIPSCTPSQAAALDPNDYCSTGPINISSSGANRRYQALQVKVDKRFAAGSQVSINYSLSTNTGFVEFTNYSDHHDAYGNLADSNRHTVSFSAVWNLPVYKGSSKVWRGLVNSWTVAGLSQISSAPPLNTILTGLDLDGDGISRTLLPGTSHNSLGYGLSKEGLRTLVAAYNDDVEARTKRVTNADGSVSVMRPRTPFNQIINPITLPAVFSNGDSFVSQDLRLTRKIGLNESLTLSLRAEAFNVFNIANLTGYSNVLNQPNYGQPSARVGQAFGTGGPRAFQFGARLEF
jgi:Carboxypeptidase regulatory-like domain